MNTKQVLILGANGQLGRALSELYPKAVKTDIDELDITDEKSVKNYDWDKIYVILNAAAYTNVDGAETPQGSKAAEVVNDKAVGYLADVAAQRGILLVHISTEYVFDGSQASHTETEPPSPLNVYGKTKAEGDKKAAHTPRHYIVRTSWVIGDGKNFVRTMLEVGKKGVSPTVVADQIGRPTFAVELARAIKFLIDNKAPYGIYNVSNSGEPVSWADFTRTIFKIAGFKQSVTDTTTRQYFASKPEAAARPLNSVLDLTKIETAGFKPRDWQDDLKTYVKKEMQK